MPCISTLLKAWRFKVTWVLFGQGRTLVGVDPAQTEFNTVEKVGGSKTVTLNASQTPIRGYLGVNGFNSGWNVSETVRGTSNSGDVRFYHNPGVDIVNAHSNLAPYITTHLWKRTL